ncbi:hypothetical protein D1224_07850 [Henriciella barbarensis]|uniref:Uncharacterized protein n=1 Tax=Henriciella barbarensis TaxID=86342 RepID=A0A399R0Z9_9PROT|nr:hypothetical protein [Henriciella barbarensis]RIJ24144.1 hypothetical protein D1224_07850 [Henriciella barbarensis]
MPSLLSSFASFKTASGTVFGAATLVYLAARLVGAGHDAALFLAVVTFFILQMSWVFAYAIIVSRDELFPRLFGYASLAGLCAWVVFGALYIFENADPVISRRLFDLVCFQYLCCSAVLANALFSGSQAKISGSLVVMLWPLTLFRFEAELRDALRGRKPWKPWRP